MIPSTLLVPPPAWYQKMQIFRYKDAQRVLSDYNALSNEYMPKSVDNLPGRSLNQMYT